MSIKTAEISIIEAVKKIEHDQLVLPALQRHFVWKIEQIEKLFESIQQQYPIGAFIFWEYDKETWKDKYERFYKFTEQLNTDTKIPAIQKQVKASGLTPETMAVVDGQQRLTSFYLGLKGHIQDGNKTKELYLKLNKLEPIIEYDYAASQNSSRKKFYFKTSEEVKQETNELIDITGIDPQDYWFKVSEIEDLTDNNKRKNFLKGKVGMKEDHASFDYALNELNKLYEAISRKNRLLLNVIEGEDSMFILESFIRLNQEGKPLSNIDFLFSVITKQWDERPGRDSIDALVQGLKDLDLVSFSKEHILMACLAIVEEPTNLQVENFGREVTTKIENNWEKIVITLFMTLNLLKHFGFTTDRMLPPKKAVLTIVATYIATLIDPSKSDLNQSARNQLENLKYAEELGKGGLLNSKYKKAREQLKGFIYQAVLAPSLEGFRYWNSKNDLKINKILDVIRGENKNSLEKEFPVEKIKKSLYEAGVPFTFTNYHLDELFKNIDSDDGRYGDAKTFPTLAILFPENDFSQTMDVDHVWPQALLTEKALTSAGVPGSDRGDIKALKHRLGNLQPLHPSENQNNKSDQNPNDWLNSLEDGRRSKYEVDHFLNTTDVTMPKDQKGFLNWFNDRSEKMREELGKKLKVEEDS